MFANKRIALLVLVFGPLVPVTLSLWPSDILAAFWFFVVIVLVGVELRAAHERFG
jgi:hypothetical protein